MNTDSQYIIEVLLGSTGGLLSISLGIFCSVVYKNAVQKYTTKHRYVGWFGVVLIVTGIWALCEVWNEQQFFGGYELALTYGVGTTLPLIFYIFVKSLDNTLQWNWKLFLFIFVQTGVILYVIHPQYGIVNYEYTIPELRLGSFPHLIFVIYMLSGSFFGLSYLLKIVYAKTISYALSMFVAIMVPFSIVATANILIPFIFLDNSFHRIGPLGLVLMAIYITYIIIKQEALKIPVILFQLYALGTILVTAIAVQIGLILFGITSIFQPERIILIVILGVIVGVLMKQTLRGLEEANLVQKVHKELESSIKAKNQFIQISSHQLRTPITAIKGYLSLLKENHLNKDDALGHYIIQMNVIVQNMSTVIEGALNINSLNSGDFSVRLDDVFDIKQQLNEIMENKSFLMNKLNIRYTYTIKGEDFIIKGDRIKIREILNNGIDNALQYGKNHIHIQLIGNKKEIQIKIQDNGIGITTAEQKIIFKPYKRGEYAKQIRQDGTGLGLYLMKLIIEAHKGTVGIKSEGRDKGSVLIITIPRIYQDNKKRSKER
jgi:signal transduction histidine kinase